MTLQQLTYLVTVAECGNITDAAERLFLSQPSLSAAIHNLEKEMGVTAFVRSNKGVTVTQEGEELLSFARMLLEQADIMQEHFGVGKKRVPKFCVSCQHYSFAVNAFVEVVKEYDADQYGFILRETQTGEIIDDVASGKSELGLLYLSESNETVLSKLLRKSELVFEELFTAAPHVFINKDHPLADRKCITLDELKPYPQFLLFFRGTAQHARHAENHSGPRPCNTVQSGDRTERLYGQLGHYRPQAEQSEHYRAAARDGRQHAHRSHPQEKRGIQPLCGLLCEGTEKASVDRLKL